MSDPEKPAWSEPLSPREDEILRLISEGLSNREIARKLFLSIDTVKWYNKQIFGKLGVSSRTQAATFARQPSMWAAPTATQAEEALPPPHNLPLQLNSFHGRTQEIARVLELLSPAPGEANPGQRKIDWLVTLTGPGGVGKTRLAVRAAFNLLEKYPDGAWLVDFAPLSDPLLVPQTVATTLGVREDGGSPILVNLTAHLAPKIALLVLDNCEHVIAACALLSAAILQTCPGVSILATSRESLRISGEISLRIDPLPVPDSDVSLPLARLADYAAVALFIERARAVLPEFSLTASNASVVTEICRRLDGLPLAIELAAARIKVLTATEIAARLDDSFHLLGRAGRNVLPRAETLQACMDWSYKLLSVEERLLLYRLAVFVGGWTLEAAEEVCAGGQIHLSEVFNLLAQLVEKSLVVVDRRQSTGMRYRFLETIYRFALEKLNASGEIAVLRGQHLAYYLKYSKNRAHPGTDRDLIAWLDQIAIEHDNLRAALDWSLTDSVDSSLCFLLAEQLHEFWNTRGFFDEGRARFARVLSRPEFTELTMERAILLNDSAWFAINQSNILAGRALLEQSQAIFERLQPEGLRGVADVLIGLAVIEYDSGEASIARKHAEQALRIANDINYPSGIAKANNMMGLSLGRLGEFELAWKHMEASLAMKLNIGEREYDVILGMGELAVREGDYMKAGEYLRRGLRLAEEAGDKWNIAVALGTLGWVDLIQKEYTLARQHLGESLAIRQEIREKGGLAWCLERLADLAAREELPDKATTLLGAAAVLRSEVNSPVNSADRPFYDALLNSLHARLDPLAFQSAWEAGSDIPLKDALEMGLAA